ncbi:MAG: hypothetical protein K0S12_2162 [Bacteroidetes bacterium]|nr:hypothetical protein [Bacteroidota bacterium]
MKRSQQFLLFVLLFVCASFKAQQATGKPGSVKSSTNDAITQTNYTYKFVSSPNNTWGYNIFANGKLVISQPHIPAINGNTGFKTKADAEKIAKLMIKKMKAGQMPPTITIEELKQNCIIK